MTRPFSRGRRFAIALVALTASALCFRSQIAAALVVRGDEFMNRNAIPQAIARYQRALTIDRDNANAADRLVFASLEARTPALLRSGIGIATQYLVRHPHDATLLADRGLCYLAERRYAAAGPDFERAARFLKDPRYFTFAGWAARRAGDDARARMLWRAALAIDAHFVPARTALASTQ